MSVAPALTGSQYLGLVLAKYSVQTGPTSPAIAAFSALRWPLGFWANGNLNQLWPSGSFAKGTPVAGTTDLDIFISLNSTTPHTLKDIYNRLYCFSDFMGWSPRRQNVSIGITYGGAKIDLVPGRLQAGSTTYHSLWRRRAQAWTQTNIGRQTAMVRDSNRRNEIRLIKIWRQCHGLDFPSFFLELMVIRALAGCHDNIESNVQRALNYIHENIETAYVIDPANTNNVVSDDLTQDEKRAIAVQAGRSYAARTWGTTLW